MSKRLEVDLAKVEILINEKMNIELSLKEVDTAKEILNTLSKNAESISSPTEILKFCNEALKYNPVSEFI